MECSKEFQISNVVWQRGSTFCIDICVNVPGVITSTWRFTGRTQLEALENLKNGIVEQLDEVIESLKPPPLALGTLFLELPKF